MADDTLNIDISRRGSNTTAMPGDEVNQTLTIYNKSDYEMFNIRVQDTLEAGVTYKDRSVVIGGTSYGDCNPINGFVLPNSIVPRNSVTLTYRVIVDPRPPKGRIKTYSDVTFKANNTQYQMQSNEFIILLENGDMTLNMTTDKVAVIKGDTLKYQNVLRNIGTVSNTEVYFQNVLPAGTTFVADSVTIDSEARAGLDPEVGFSLPDLTPNSTVTITFDVTID